MNRRTVCFVSAIVVSAMLVLGVGLIQAQTPGQIPRFDPASGAGSCNAAGAIDCVDSVITQDASNNIGIGTTSPSMSLDVMQASLYGVPAIGGKIPAPGVVPPFDWAYLHVQTFPFGPALIWGHGDLPMRFGNENSIGSGFVELMRIAGNGSVGIGTTAPDQLLSVNGNASKIGGGFWAVFSDDRLKTIHGTFDAGLNEVLKLKPIRYRYNKDNPLDIRDEGEHIGLSAQEVQGVIPEAVTESRKGYLMLNSDPVLWAMLNAIKEQQKMIDELKKKASEIDGLRAQLSEMHELKGQMSKLQSLLQTVLAQRPEESGSVLTSGR